MIKTGGPCVLYSVPVPLLPPLPTPAPASVGRSVDGSVGGSVGASETFEHDWGLFVELYSNAVVVDGWSYLVLA